MDIMELKYRILSKHCFKEYNNMAVNKTQSNDKLVWKIKPSSFHMKLKSFNEASCTNNIYTGEKVFWTCYFWRFVSCFIIGHVK